MEQPATLLDVVPIVDIVIFLAVPLCLLAIVFLQEILEVRTSHHPSP